MTKRGEHPEASKIASSKRLKLGELLVKAGLIDAAVLEDALALQKVQNKKIGQVLIDMGIVDHVALGRALADQLRIPFVTLRGREIHPAVLAKVPAEMAEKYTLIPVGITKEKLAVAVSNPLEFSGIDDLQFVTEMPVSLVVSPRDEILAAIEKYYPKTDIAKYLNYDVSVPADMEIVKAAEREEWKAQDLLNIVDLPPVVRFTNMVIAEAIRLRASDIHIEPAKDHLTIRCRIDGVMHETMKTDRHIHASLVSRVKVIAGMDIAIRRKPQDGKAQVNFDGKRYDLRVSTIPTSDGEKATIRVLNPATAKMSPEDLGFSAPVLDNVLDTIHRPQGILLVTGPTGSGKSSTLYACLNHLNAPSVNIITVEDPVEFDVEGINQVQINPKAGITFAAGLRSILRQDPDIVMVGEIRDAETAGVAFQAAQTGHLVLSTLHTNDAPSAVTRLMDLGLDDFQIAAALLAVIGQRLVRRIHDACKTVDGLDARTMARIRAALGKSPAGTIYRGAGCNGCMGSGYAGRVGIYEMLTVTPSLKSHIAANVPAHAIQRAAEAEGFQTLTQDGISKALQGLTSIEEVFRVAPPPLVSTHPVSEDGVRIAPPAQTPTAAGAAAPISSGAGTTPPPLRPPTGEDAGGIQKILVVDDDEDMRKLLKHVLLSQHYSVLTAADGKAALQIAAAEAPGLIITDYGMPEMDGMALIGALKSSDATRDIPIIMLTAVDDTDAEVAVIDAGADDYLTKPINKIRLLARVQRFFTKRKKILVVDDSDDVRKLIQHILRSENVLTVTAASVDQAQALIREAPPDLIITDYLMPEKDGMALIRDVKSRESTQHIPIIMLTAVDEVESEAQIIDAGADDYLTKPVNAKRLVSRVKRLLR